MVDEADLEFDPSNDDDGEMPIVPVGKRAVYTEPADAEVESLFNKYKRGKLVVQPDFQREYVWDGKRASRLIESALLSIPIPIVYISEEPDNKEYVIDGQQRLTSFFSFMDGKFPDGGEFKLTGLKVFSELNGKVFADLSDAQQDEVRYCKLRTVTFKKESDGNLKFEIFERLNTGSVPLNDQELRNCVYRGAYNDLVHELSRDPDFEYLLDLSKPDKRRKDVELVLRFCALYSATYLKYKPPMKSFLNADAAKNRDLTPEDAKALRAAFKNACQVIRSMLGKNAFKRFYRGVEGRNSGRWETKKFNASLYDVLMVTLADQDKNKVFGSLDSVREALISLMTENQEFINSIELSTSSVQAMQKRFDLWRSALDQAVGGNRKEPRCFTRALKEALFEADSTCTICRQRIDHVDDAAIDHIEQYWTGGKTIPENARLTHRFCNWSRSRKE